MRQALTTHAPFDWDVHQHAAADAYRNAHKRYEAFAQEVGRVLATALAARSIPVASVESRIKDERSFIE